MRTGLRALVVLCLFGLTAMFNIGLVDIRIQEIDYLLGKVADDQEVSNALGIVAKYELIKRRLELGEDDAQSYEFEAKMQALTSGDQFKHEDAGVVRKLYLAPIRTAVNGIRLALGKEIINTEEEDKIFNVLEIGYFWERARKYHDAIKIYDQVLDMPALSPGIRAAVLLHKAFCHSMISDYKTAKQIYERVINQYPNTDAGMLAWKLLDFINTMETKRETVKYTQLDDFEKAKQFYLLMDYRNAIKYFARFLGNKKDTPQGVEATFFKGRSHEELGETQEAIDEYRRVIRTDKSKRWAREANRRLLMLGEFYEQKKQMAEEARRQLAAYQDQSFMNNVERFAGMVSESSLKGELTKQKGEEKQELRLADADIMRILNEIDLTGLDGSSKKEEKEKIKEIEEKLASEGRSKAEIDVLIKRTILSQHAFRRPTALNKVIDENSSQLRYLYTKRLRKGIPLAGKMDVEIKIRPDGTVSSTRVLQSNIGDTEFEDQVTSKVLAWRFRPVADSLGTLTIIYPFEFHQED